ncbi:MAG TPA: ATP-binding protein [Solirubrobacteraceae bacterium]|nr:ATP-binding protein [Solirubrobacteraceae bacterium]
MRRPRPRPTLLGRPRPTLRLRLTLLYGVVFILAGAGLLTATYALFKHNQSSTGASLSIRGAKYTLPKGVSNSVFTPGLVVGQGGTATSGGGQGVVTQTRTVPSGPSAVRVPSDQVLNKIKTSGQRQLLILAQRANVQLRRSQASDASSLLEWSAIALGVVALLSIGIAWWLSGRALRPLRTMNARAREISAENLHERLGVGNRRDELGELSTTFDALLGRLEAAFESQRRFVANASHELRTPITLERTLVEVALADPDASLDSLRAVCERVVTSTEEQERLLDALLTLARSEAGVGSGETVDLAVLLEDALLVREPRLTGVAVESSLEPAVVIGDQALLERLVSNLVENAIVHNGGGAAPWLSICSGEIDGAPGLRIANSGDVVASEQVEELFEPFRRGVGERLGSDGDGLGLGLSIVRAVVVAHGAQIGARGLPDGGLEFELRFPSVGGLSSVTGDPQAVPA